jgi:hypothetical protein
MHAKFDPWFGIVLDSIPDRSEESTGLCYEVIDDMDNASALLRELLVAILKKQNSMADKVIDIPDSRPAPCGCKSVIHHAPVCPMLLATRVMSIIDIDSICKCKPYLPIMAGCPLHDGESNG